MVQLQQGRGGAGTWSESAEEPSAPDSRIRKAHAYKRAAGAYAFM